MAVVWGSEARPFPEQDGVARWDQLARGGVTRDRLRAEIRNGSWTQLHRGVYLVDEQRRQGDAWVQARAASLALPGAVVCQSTAAAVWGIAGSPTSASEVAVRPGRKLRSRPDLVVHTYDLRPGEVVRRRGLLITSPGRTVEDLVVTNDRLAAIAVCDSALRRGLLTPADLLRLRDGCVGRPGSLVTRDVWALADARAESVLESRVRLRAVDGGYPPDDLQVEIRDEASRFLARGDLCYRSRRCGRTGLLIVEADGSAVHGSEEALFKDRSRANAFVALGHDTVRVVWRDTLDELTIPRAIHHAL